MIVLYKVGVWAALPPALEASLNAGVTLSSQKFETWNDFVDIG